METHEPNQAQLARLLQAPSRSLLQRYAGRGQQGGSSEDAV